jgi:hypothetical protein
MRTHRRVLAPLLLMAAVCCAFDSDSARPHAGERTTVLVYDAQEGIYLSEEVDTPRPLRDSVVLLGRTHRIRRMPDPSVRIGLDGAVARLRARLRSGEWLAMPGGALDYLLSEEIPMDATVESESCYTVFRSSDGRILCANGCSDCYVVKIKP